jgi:hypothetical protein
VFNARGLVCGCENRARKLTPHARVMYFGKKSSKNPYDAGLHKLWTLKIAEGDWVW